MEFAVVGNVGKSMNEIEQLVRRKGGKVVTTIHDKLAAIISNRNEVQAMGYQMVAARSSNIQVVSVEFLTHIENGNDPILYIMNENLCQWGGNVRFEY